MKVTLKREVSGNILIYKLIDMHKCIIQKWNIENFHHFSKMEVDLALMGFPKISWDSFYSKKELSL